MTVMIKKCDEKENEYLDKTFPHKEKGEWFDLTEILNICEVVDGCEDCPRYGDDCDGMEAEE